MDRRNRWLEPVLALLVVALVAFLALRPEKPAVTPTPEVAVSTPTPASTPTPLTPQQQYAGCVRNLEAMLAELRQTYGDRGAVPLPALQAISVRYRCPAASQFTYSATGDGSMENLILFCRGKHHEAAGIPENFPDLHATRGLNRGFDPEGKLGLPTP
ncbi:MAG: hypothetical protein AB1758_30540 [Candidatus Eremiobacterota bacterium]